jgi:predicted DNA-binding protein
MTDAQTTQLVIRVPVELAARLKQTAAKREQTVSQLVRLAVREWLDERGNHA